MILNDNRLSSNGDFRIRAFFPNGSEPSLNRKEVLMFFTTKGRYGLISMFELAKLDGFGPVPLSEISKRVSVSLGYLEQIFLVLRKSGLIKSVRGAKGGYVLAKRPSEISVGDILKNLEGPLVAAECVMKGETDSGVCDTYESCATRVVLTKVTQAVDKVIESTSLQDMLVDAYFVAGIKGLQATEPDEKK